MRAILDGTGRLLALGGESLVVPEGGQALDLDDAGEASALAALAAVADGQEAHWDGAAFAVRARTYSAEETAFRQDVQTVKTFMGAPNGSATDAQRDAVFKAT